MQNQEYSADAYVNTILTRIKDLLSKKSISQKEFAELCSISPSIVSKLLAGKSTLTIKLVYIMILIIYKTENLSQYFPSYTKT